MSKYCVIGAGPAGLASMKTLLDAGLEFDCFERTQDVGGHWNTDYEALHLITSSKVTGYEGHPMPEDWPIFPSRKLMLQYFEDFAKEFDLKKYVSFGVSVEKVTPLSSDGPTGSAGWTVTTSDGKTNTYDGIFVANGHLWDEKRVEFPGEFAGKTIHSGSYVSTKDIQGTRVLVIGSGNSGCDVAVDAAQNHFETDIVIRRGHFFQPKTFFGVPRAELGWMQEFTFEEQDLIARLMIRLSVGTHENYPGMPAPDHRTLADGPPVVNQLLLYWIHHGRIAVKPGIEKFAGNTVHFTDGTSKDYDTILYATGFHASLPFLDEEHIKRRDGVPLRVGAAVVPLGLEKFYLIGMIGPRGPQPPVYPIQAKLAVEMIRLHQNSGGFQPIAGPLEKLQDQEWRIDILRPIWLEQVEHTKSALSFLADSQKAPVTA